MKDEHTQVEVRFIDLMKRLRELGLDACPGNDGIISPSQMILLDQIAASPGCGVRDIADKLKLSPATVSVGVSKIEESNLVERKPSPLDGRAVQIFLTQHGQALQEKIQGSHRQKFRHLLAGLTPKEQETLLKLLERALQSAENEVSYHENILDEKRNIIV